MPAPFPVRVHIGTDICHIPRIAVIARKYPKAFAKRLLTAPERMAYESILLFEKSKLAEEGEKSRQHYIGDGVESDAGREVSQEERERWRGVALERKEMREQTNRAGLTKRIQFLAGRWAAKEALIKASYAAGRRGVTWGDLLILPDHWKQEMFYGKGVAGPVSGPPKAVVLSKSMLLGREDWAERWRLGDEARLSISHDGEYATAVAMVTEEESAVQENLGDTAIMTSASLAKETPSTERLAHVEEYNRPAEPGSVGNSKKDSRINAAGSTRLVLEVTSEHQSHREHSSSVPGHIPNQETPTRLGELPRNEQVPSFADGSSTLPEPPAWQRDMNKDGSSVDDILKFMDAYRQAEKRGQQVEYKPEMSNATEGMAEPPTTHQAARAKMRLSRKGD